jgi:hypothetical protein
MLLYPKSKLIAWICFDAAFTILVLIASGLRFFQQRTLRPLARSYIVGNITISLSTLCITAWTIISAMARVQYMRWEDNPVGYPPPWTREGHFVSENLPAFFFFFCNHDTDQQLVAVVAGWILVHPVSLADQALIPLHLFPRGAAS